MLISARGGTKLTHLGIDIQWPVLVALESDHAMGAGTATRSTRRGTVSASQTDSHLLPVLRILIKTYRYRPGNVNKLPDSRGGGGDPICNELKTCLEQECCKIIEPVARTPRMA